MKIALCEEACAKKLLCKFVLLSCFSVFDGVFDVSFISLNFESLCNECLILFTVTT